MRAQQYQLYADMFCHTFDLGAYNGSGIVELWCQDHGCKVGICQNPKCGKKFHTHRTHTKTCSDNCRKALSRLEKKAGK